MTDPLTEPAIRPLAHHDLPHLLDLCSDRGWPRDEHKWRLLLSVGTVYGVDAPDGGGLAGCYSLTRYGDEIAAIGMVLVADRYARRGLGRRMMNHALDAARTPTVSLYATSYGRPLYERVGFKMISTVLMRTGEFVPDPVVATEAVRPARGADLEAIRAFDLTALGADRTPVLTRLPTLCDHLLVAEGGDGRLEGFAGGWPSMSNTVAGPVVASDATVARALVSKLAAVTDGPLRIDVDVRHVDFSRWLDDRGLTVAGSNAAMVWGRPDLPGDPSRLFAPVTLAL